jgi:hypothetical protein
MFFGDNGHPHVICIYSTTEIFSTVEHCPLCLWFASTRPITLKLCTDIMLNWEKAFGHGRITVLGQKY